MSSELVPWVVLAIVVGSVLVFDLLILHRDARPVPLREAAAWTAVWVSLSLAFGAYIALARGGDAGGEYLAGYLIELSLSVDNVFVFALIFAAFAVPAAYQHRLLFWGILGAIVFRALFIAAGTAILAAAHWVIYLLGVLLVVTGIRLARSQGHAVQPERNPVLRLVRRIVPMTANYRGGSFFVREGGRRVATPLLAVLVAIETTDIMFALDSIPAVFAITTDPLVVFSSNLFAILGLRSLYFLLAGLLDRFVYLKLGLSALLVFAGAKILVGSIYKIPIGASLAIIIGILAISVAASLIATHPRRSELLAPVLRVASGVAFGLAGLTLLIFAGAVRAGAAWPGPVAVTFLVGSGALATAVGMVGPRRGLPPFVATAAVRLGAVLLLATGSILALVALRDLDALWIAADVAIGGGVAAIVILTARHLRRAAARPAVIRGWAMVGTTLLLLAALFVGLE